MKSLSSAQASMMAQLYTLGGIARTDRIARLGCEWRTLDALRRRGLVTVSDGLVQMTAEAWGRYPPEPQLNPRTALNPCVLLSDHVSKYWMGAP